jgi:hypothetical protein
MILFLGKYFLDNSYKKFIQFKKLLLQQRYVSMLSAVRYVEMQYSLGDNPGDKYVECFMNLIKNESVPLCDVLNTPCDDKSYWIHYAAQQNSCLLFKRMLEEGAELFDKEGNLLKGNCNKNIFEFCHNPLKLYFIIKKFYKSKGDQESINKIDEYFESK